MRKSGNKVLIIVLIVIAILAVLLGSFAYIYFATDMFKSEKELFAQYLTQNFTEITQTINIEKINEIEEKLKESKYEEKITLSFAEEKGTEPVEQIMVEKQYDSINKKMYLMLSLMMEGIQDSLDIEYIIENNMYSLRFTDAVKEFITIENDNLKQLAMNLGIDEETVEQIIPETINFEKFSFKDLKFTEEEKQTELNKYFQLLYNSFGKEKYQKNKNTVITLNGKTITTNAYRLTLNMQDIRNAQIKLLETLKQDEIVLAKLQKIDEMTQAYELDSIKESFAQTIQNEIDFLNEEEIIEDENIVITVYEEKRKTVRIRLEQGIDYITIDTIQKDGKKQIDIDYTSIDEENTQLSKKITIIKENDNQLSIQLKNVEEEEQYNINLSVQLTENENNKKIDVVIEFKENQIMLSRNINIVDEINFNVTLDDTNNIILNELTAKQISYIFGILEERLNTEYIEPLEKEVEPIITLLEMLNIGEESIFTEEELQFNSKFQQFEGNFKSTQEVNQLLNTVYLHNSLEKQKDNPRYVSVTGIVTLEPDASKTEEVQDGKYSIQCMYQNSFVDKIWILKENEMQLD